MVTRSAGFDVSCQARTLAARIRYVPVQVRDYEPADEQSWLRCRALSFLDTAYFDDVMTAKKSVLSGAELVAVDSGAVVGVLDLTVDGVLATIDTIAVHPDHQGRGIGSSLLDLACVRAAALGADKVDAWTRDDESALTWYRSRGFSESSHYLHVYANHYASVFLHAALTRETEMRAKFTRVHVCRRFVRPIVS
jgi:ribosomal protein S18 acetylase RimI-like enzyme